MTQKLTGLPAAGRGAEAQRQQTRRQDCRSGRRSRLPIAAARSDAELERPRLLRTAFRDALLCSCLQWLMLLCFMTAVTGSQPLASKCCAVPVHLASQERGGAGGGGATLQAAFGAYTFSCLERLSVNLLSELPLAQEGRADARSCVHVSASIDRVMQSRHCVAVCSELSKQAERDVLTSQCRLPAKSERREFISTESAAC